MLSALMSLLLSFVYFSLAFAFNISEEQLITTVSASSVITGYWNTHCNNTHFHIGTGPCDCGSDGHALETGGLYPTAFPPRPSLSVTNTANSSLPGPTAGISVPLVTAPLNTGVSSSTSSTSDDISPISASASDSSSALGSSVSSFHTLSANSSVTVGPIAYPTGVFPPSGLVGTGTGYYNPHCGNGHVHHGTG